MVSIPDRIPGIFVPVGTEYQSFIPCRIPRNTIISELADRAEEVSQLIQRADRAVSVRSTLNRMLDVSFWCRHADSIVVNTIGIHAGLGYIPPEPKDTERLARILTRSLADPRYCSAIHNIDRFSGLSLSRSALLRTVHNSVTGEGHKFRHKFSILRYQLGNKLLNFLPPPPEYVPHLIEDMFNFIEDASIPLLIRLAVVNHRLHIIHPFPDGNGRTSAVFLLILFVQAKISQTAWLPILQTLQANRGTLRALHFEMASGCEANYLNFFLGCCELAGKSALFER
jgi:hypothetical protein